MTVSCSLTLACASEKAISGTKMALPMPISATASITIGSVPITSGKGGGGSSDKDEPPWPLSKTLPTVATLRRTRNGCVGFQTGDGGVMSMTVSLVAAFTSGSEARGAVCMASDACPNEVAVFDRSVSVLPICTINHT